MAGPRQLAQLKQQASFAASPRQQAVQQRVAQLVPQAVSGLGAGRPVVQRLIGRRAGHDKTIRLKRTEKAGVYVHSATGTLYEVTSPIVDDHADVKKIKNADKLVHADWRHDKFDIYKNWDKDTNTTLIGPFGGKLSAYHSRGSAFVRSNEGDFNGAKLGDTYVEYVRGITSRVGTGKGKLSNAQVATALLDLDQSVFTTDLEKRAASMLHTTVYLAEEWRKQGAAKIYRGLLHQIAAGDADFEDLLERFAFIESAEAGRRMTARFMDVSRGDVSIEKLSKGEKRDYRAMTPERDGDYSSDDELRKRKKLKTLARDYSKANKDAPKWKSAWSGYPS